MEVVEAYGEVRMARPRILVIEDDAALATMFESALSCAGYDVDVSGDGLTALEDIDEGHPDLVVLDLHLPQLDGATILREVEATPDTSHIPVIVVTGCDADELGASMVLRKPCDPAQLVAAVQQHLRRAAA